MKLAFVIHNEHYTAQVMELLARCEIDYYTRWEQAMGKGHQTEPHLGRGGYPSLNGVLMIGFEDEAPLARSWMGNHDERRRNRLAFRGDEIQVERARPPPLLPHPPVPALDAMKFGQKLGRLQARLDDGHRVEERRLPGTANRLCLVEARNGRNRPQFRELREGRGQVITPVAEVGAETDRVSGHRPRSTVTETSENDTGMGASGL